MEMSTYDKVRQARNLQEAILVVAEALDRIESRLDEPVEVPSPSGWDAWSPAAEPPRPTTPQGADHTARDDAAARQQEIEDVRQQMAGADEDEARALQARLRLLEDNGGVVETLPDGTRATTEVSGDQITVDIPLAMPEQRNARLAFARKHELGSQINPPLPQHEAEKAFVVGGPEWVYNYDRDSIMTWPEAWRRALVEDLAIQSPKAAHEMGRDILKSMDAGGPEITLEALGG